jgi:YHS domain-containing protein
MDRTRANRVKWDIMNILTRKRLVLSGISSAFLLLGITTANAQEEAKVQEKPKQTQRQNAVRSVPVCAMKLEPIEKPGKALSSEFNGKKALFCCPNCKAAFDKLDDAGKEKKIKVAGLTSRKLGLEKQLEQLKAEIKALDGEKTEEKVAVASVVAKASGVVYCAITDEEIESADKAYKKVAFNGKDYYFCCAGCVTKFNKDSAKLAAEADKRAAARK